MTRFEKPTTRIRLPNVAPTRGSSAIVSWIRNGTRAVVFRPTESDRASLHVVDMRTRGTRTYEISGAGFAGADEVAVAGDGRIAFLHTLPAHDPPLCGAPDQFRLYAVDPRFKELAELRILPPEFKLDPRPRVFVDALAWSSRGMLSYVVGRCAPGGWGDADSVVVTSAAPGAVPRRVAPIRGGRSYATAWSPDGRQLAVAYTGFRNGKPATSVDLATLGGAVKRIATPSTQGTYVDLDWSSAAPILYTMDNGFADLTKIRIRARRAQRLWLPNGNWPTAVAAVSHDGRFVGLGKIVLDVKARRRWRVRWPRDAADFSLG